MKVYFVRHGSCSAAEAEPPVHPFPSDPLSERGISQTYKLITRFRQQSIDCLLASDIARARQTAEIIGNHLDIPLIASPLFAEWLMPECIFGKSCSDYPKGYLTFRHERESNRNAKYENGESLAEVMIRVRNAKKYLSEQARDNIVVVSHYNFIKFFAIEEILPSNWSGALLLKLAGALELTHTGVCLFESDKSSKPYRILSWNERSHLSLRSATHSGVDKYDS